MGQRKTTVRALAVWAVLAAESAWEGVLTDWAGSRVALAVGGADAEPVLSAWLKLVDDREGLGTDVHLRKVDVRVRLALALYRDMSHVDALQVQERLVAWL